MTQVNRKQAGGGHGPCFCECGGKVFFDRQNGAIFCEECLYIWRKAKDNKTPETSWNPHSGSGQPAFGYRWSGPKGKRKIVPDPREQKVLARIIELRNDGLAPRKILEALNREKLYPRRAKKWTYSNIFETITLLVEREGGGMESG